MSERGQTAYDYLLGIVLLLVAIITVLSLFPQVFGPFVDPVSTDRQKAADRVAAEVIEANATMDGERTLDVVGLQETVENSPEAYIEYLRNRTGVGEFRNVNVSIQTRPGGQPEFAAGNPRRPGEPTATTVRNVRSVVADPGGEWDCQEGCKLIVRVW